MLRQVTEDTRNLTPKVCGSEARPESAGLYHLPWLPVTGCADCRCDTLNYPHGARFLFYGSARAEDTSHQMEGCSATREGRRF